MSLKYSPNVIKVGFADSQIEFSDKKLSVSEQLGILCDEVDKTKFTPIFVDDKKFCSKIPSVISKVSVKIAATSVPNVVVDNITKPNVTTTTTTTKGASVQDLTIPPDTKNTDLLNAALLGLGIIVIIKILS